MIYLPKDAVGGDDLLDLDEFKNIQEDVELLSLPKDAVGGESLIQAEPYLLEETDEPALDYSRLDEAAPPQQPSPVRELMSKFMDNTEEDIGARTAEIARVFSEDFQDPLAGPTVVAGQTLGVGYDIATNVLMSGVDGIALLVPDEYEDTAKQAAKGLLDILSKTPVANSFRKMTEKLGSSTEGLRAALKEFPEYEALLDSAINIGVLPIPSKDISKLAKLDVSETKILKAEASKLDQELNTITKTLLPESTPQVKEERLRKGLYEIESSGTGRGRIIETYTDDEKKAGELAYNAGVRSKNLTTKNLGLLTKDIEKRDKKVKAMLGVHNDKALTAGVVFKTVSSRINKAINDTPIVASTSELKNQFTKYTELLQKIAVKEGAISPDGKITPLNIYKLRQEFDREVARKSGMFPSGDKANAQTLAVKTVRNSLNDLVDFAVPEGKVREQRKEASLLLEARDNILPKASKEADSSFSRTVEIFKDKLATKRLMNQATITILGTTAGTAAYGISATLPYVAGGVVSLVAANALRKGYQSPKTKKAMLMLRKGFNRMSEDVVQENLGALKAQQALIAEVLKLPVNENAEDEVQELIMNSQVLQQPEQEQQQ